VDARAFEIIIKRWHNCILQIVSVNSVLGRDSSVSTGTTLLTIHLWQYPPLHLLGRYVDNELRPPRPVVLAEEPEGDKKGSHVSL
jgi:hypothetical protein